MFIDPLYNPTSFHTGAVLRGTATAVLTYIGFDGISTLTDEARDPERNVPRAIVMTCVITGVLAAVEVYFAQLAWPRGAAFPDINTAYVYVSGRIGGPVLFAVVNAALLLATIGSGMASQLGRGAAFVCDGAGWRAAAEVLCGSGPQEPHPAQQRDPDWGDLPGGGVPDELLAGRGPAEFRRAAGVYGRECVVGAAGMAAWRMEAVAAYRVVAGGVCHLRGAVVEPGS